VAPTEDYYTEHYRESAQTNCSAGIESRRVELEAHGILAGREKDAALDVVCPEYVCAAAVDGRLPTRVIKIAQNQKGWLAARCPDFG
jgi:hypothetical protein